MESQMYHDSSSEGEEEEDRHIPAVVCTPQRSCRVTLIKASETEFKLLNQKLESLSVTLQSIVENKTAGSSPSTTSLQQQVGDLLTTMKLQPEDDHVYEGGSSFQSHSDQVAQFFKESLDTPPISEPNSRSPSRRPTYNDSSSTLAHTTQTATSLLDIAKLPLPPSELVLAALRFSRGLAPLYVQFLLLTRSQCRKRDTILQIIPYLDRE